MADTRDVSWDARKAVLKVAHLVGWMAVMTVMTVALKAACSAALSAVWRAACLVDWLDNLHTTCALCWMMSHK